MDDAVRKLATDMLVSMYAASIGLASADWWNQQLLVIDLELDDPNSLPLVLINPEITSVGGGRTYEEGCLSIPAA